MNQINNILFSINYNVLKKFYLKNLQKMTTLEKQKFSNFLNLMFKQKPVGFFLLTLWTNKKKI